MDQSTSRKIPILIIADCEPDLRETTPGRPVPWTGFERFFDFISGQRARMSDRAGIPARLSWFWRMDPQIALTYGSADWAVRTYASRIAEMRQQGDEAGLHVHAWRWDVGLSRWIGDHANGPWIEQCIRDAFAEFERAFGEPCRLFRFGDGWLDDATVELIEQLGAQIDLTLEPGGEGKPSLVSAELATGRIPDRRTVPERPYRPSTKDFRKSERTRDGGLWMLPVTTGPLPRQFHDSPQPLDSRSWITGRPHVQLNLGIEPLQFASIFQRAISTAHRPYAAICVRTDVGSNDGLMARVEENFRGLLNHRLSDQFLFTTPTEALALLIDNDGDRLQ